MKKTGRLGDFSTLVVLSYYVLKHLLAIRLQQRTASIVLTVPARVLIIFAQFAIQSGEVCAKFPNQIQREAFSERMASALHGLYSRLNRMEFCGFVSGVREESAIIKRCAQRGLLHVVGVSIIDLDAVVFHNL